jgi:DNA-binding SARP family transcriptional activator
LTFHLLGGAAILEGEAPLSDLRSRTAEALLIYLACHERPISRQFLADFFWDERSEQQAAANLRSILSMLRKQVGPYLIATRQALAFDHNQEHWVDSADFESRMQAVEPLLNRASLLDDQTHQQLKTTLDLYQGDFLQGFYLSESRGFEEWVLVTRERLRRLAAVGLRRLGHH